MPNYNPYDLIELFINNHHTYGRPVAFDTEVLDHFKMTNSNGDYIKPTQVATTCPDCGSGLTISVDLPNPPFCPIYHTCSCKDVPVFDPFINPIHHNRIDKTFLDPKLSLPTSPSELALASEEVALRTEHLKSYAQPPKVTKKIPRKHGTVAKSGFKPDQPKPLPEFKLKAAKADDASSPEIKGLKDKDVKDKDLRDKDVKDQEGNTESEDNDLIRTLNEIEEHSESYIDKLLDELE